MRTKARVISLCRAADGLGRRRRAGQGRWHGYGSRNNTLGFVPGPRGCPAEVQSYWAWKTSGLPGVGDTQKRTCCLSRKKKWATWGCYMKGQALPLAKLGPARAGIKRPMGLPIPSQPLGTDLRVPLGWVQRRGCLWCGSFSQCSQRGQPTRTRGSEHPHYFSVGYCWLSR